MKIEVHFFSRLRDLSGLSRVDRELSDGQTIGDLLEVIYVECTSLREWDQHILTAVNEEYAERDYVLKEGDNVSIMPPVSGG